MVVALNKIDRLPADMPLVFQGLPQHCPRVQISAAQGTGIDELLRCISDTLTQQFVPVDVLIPYERGDLVAQSTNLALSNTRNTKRAVPACAVSPAQPRRTLYSLPEPAPPKRMDV